MLDPVMEFHPEHTRPGGAGPVKTWARPALILKAAPGQAEGQGRPVGGAPPSGPRGLPLTRPVTCDSELVTGL